MTYQKGQCVISVQQIDGIGKNKSLWIGTENQRYKVATFCNDDKADQFCKYLEYFLFDREVTEDEGQA